MKLVDDIGIIAKLYNDSKVTEIMVLNSGVYYEKNDIPHKADVEPLGEEKVMKIIDKISLLAGIDNSIPFMDVRLPDGTKINAIIPPLAVDGPLLAIRKYRELSLDELINYHTFSEREARFFKDCVEGGLNIIVCGTCGSGRTTTLNALASFVPDEEKIVVIEDVPVLQLEQPHVKRLKTGSLNAKNRSNLIKDAVQMKANRIIIDDFRYKDETLETIEAMNTGCTLLIAGYADNPQELITGLEFTMLMSSMGSPSQAIRKLQRNREQIANSIDLIIQQTRMLYSKRRITQVTAVLGVEGDSIVLQDLLKYDDYTDSLVPVPGRERAIEMLQKKGINIPHWMREHRREKEREKANFCVSGA